MLISFRIGHMICTHSKHICEQDIAQLLANGVLADHQHHNMAIQLQ